LPAPSRPASSASTPGASAFFLSEDFGGSESAAATAAVRTARDVGQRAKDLRAGSGSPIRANAGVHWGSTLVIGQVVTSGRLEITALGDEVNETARIEDVASGEVLASKHLIERIDPDDVEALGIDTGALTYRPLAHLEGASEKAVRDAGGIPVAAI
jgi:class 3 adenylate cyclase